MNKDYLKNKALIWSIIIFVLIGYGLSKVGSIGIWGSAKLMTTFSVDATKINGINVALSSSDIEIEEYSGNEIKIEIFSNRDEDDIATIEQNGATLEIKENKKLKITIGFNIGNNRVQIYIPKGTSLNYDLQTSSGNIKLESEQAKKITAKASSGNIKVKANDTNTILLNTSSGNIKVYGTIISLRAEATSGNIDLEDVKADDIYAEANSGNIKGNVETDILKAYASSGNINIRLLEMPNISIIAKANSGNVELKLPRNDGFILEYSTSSGYVRNDFTGLKAEKSGTDIYEGGSVIIQATTSSGNVKIED